MDLSAPDGSNQPFNSTQLRSFFVPAWYDLFVYGYSNAVWEQAVVVYANGVRGHSQMGNYSREDHNGFFFFGQPNAVTLSFAGWHKRSQPDGNEPWHASNGRQDDHSASWDDSGGDRDFDDFVIEVVMREAVVTGTRSVFPKTKAISQASRVADFITYVAARDHVGVALDRARSTATTPHGELICQMIAAYQAIAPQATIKRRYMGHADELAAELVLRAHSFQEGNLRSRLLKLAEEAISVQHRQTRNLRDSA